MDEIAKRKITCPACGSDKLITTDDMIRNVGILMCDACGEAYAFDRYDLDELGVEAIMREWHGSYYHQRRLGNGQE